MIAFAPPPVLDEQSRARRARGLAALAKTRVANSVLRLSASAIVAAIAAALLPGLAVFCWLGGLAVLVWIDRTLYQRLLARCEAGDPPLRMPGLLAWTAFQSAYGNIMAALLWFAPFAPGQTLAVIYICGGLANAAATLRSSPALSIAGVGPCAAFLLGLPLVQYLLNGARNSLELMPLVGGFLLLGFGANLWRSLIASDVAHAQAEEAALRERRAAAAAAAAKSDVIRRMNDELRTPMAALVGAAEHLRRTAVTPQAQAHIATLCQAGEVLKLVLSDLSDLDRLQNGELLIETAPADPRELARSVVSAFRASAHDKNLELFLDIAPGTPAAVDIDAPRVRQILFNLLANAIRYTSHGGVRMQLWGQPGEDEGAARLRFAVADTGAGMSRAHLALIFERERFCGEGQGPGLGLAISLRLARLMGGQLAAKSELGQGSVFCLTLEAPLACEHRWTPYRDRNVESRRESAAASRVSHSQITSADHPAAASEASAAASRSRLRPILARQ